MTKDEIEAAAKDLWDQRERAVKDLMRKLHGVKNFKTMPWQNATEKGRDLLRRRAIWLQEHGKPNDWLQIDE